MEIAHAHDHFFKSLVEQPGVAAALLKERLPPEIAKALGDDEPELLPGTFVDEKLRENQTDRLFRVRRRDGGIAYIRCLIEHKSEPDPRAGVQLLRYLAGVWTRLSAEANPSDKLPIIVPLLVYHGPTKWPDLHRFSDGLDVDDELRPLVLDFPITVFEVTEPPEQELSAHPWLRAGLKLLKYAYRFPKGDPVEILQAVLEDLRGVAEAFFVAALHYIYVEISGIQREDLRDAVKRVVPGKAEDMVSKALQEELFIARKQERSESLVQILEHRFGPVPESVRNRIARASLEELAAWLPRALDANSIAGVFEER